MSTVIPMSDRGTITIPSHLRDKLKVNRFECKLDGEKLVLEPLYTREEFYAELDAAEKDWEENGGITLEEMKAKYSC